MKTRIVTVLVLLPALIVSMTLPAHAIFGSIIAGIQRAQMIVNQGLQIYEQQIAKLTMDGQLLQLTDQFGHLQDQALGAVGEIADPFTTMASQPTRMIGTAPRLEERIYRERRRDRERYRGDGLWHVPDPDVAGALEGRRHRHGNRSLEPLRPAGNRARRGGNRGLPGGREQGRRTACSEFCHQ